MSAASTVKHAASHRARRMRTILLVVGLLAVALVPLGAPPALACHPEGPEPDPNHHGCGGNMDPLACLADPKRLPACLRLP